MCTLHLLIVAFSPSEISSSNIEMLVCAMIKKQGELTRITTVILGPVKRSIWVHLQVVSLPAI